MTSGTNIGNIEEQVEEFCQELSAQGKSASTVKNRYSDLQHLSKWITKRNQKASSFVNEPARMWPAYQALLLKYFEPNTVNRRMSSARQFAKWASRKHQTSTDAPPPQRAVRDRRARLDRRPQTFIDISVIDKLIEAAEAEQDLQAIAIFQLIGKNGLRPAEIIALRWEQLRVKRGKPEIEIPERVSKSATSIPLLREVFASILSLRVEAATTPNGEIFRSRNGAYTRRALETLIAKYSRRVGVLNITAGALRTACISTWVEKLSTQEIALLAGEQITDHFRSKGTIPAPPEHREKQTGIPAAFRKRRQDG